MPKIQVTSLFLGHGVYYCFCIFVSRFISE